MKGEKAPAFVAALALSIVIGAAGATVLDDYTAAPDPACRYSLYSTTPGFLYQTFVLDVTSQTWRSPAEVERTEWRHWLHITVPRVVSYDTALLVVSGGSNGNAPDTTFDGQIAQLAVLSQSVIACLEDVPNQPLHFADRQEGLVENAIIAYSWDKYFTTGGTSWIVQLPMVKSVVRAMDAVQQFCATPEAGARRINHFAVSGASKRGWAAWLAAAVDARVIGVAPMVIDLLNMQPSFRHHYGAYGLRGRAVEGYKQADVFARFNSERGRTLAAIVDPYAYRDRLTMPKYLLNAAGDNFFPPDSWRFYWRDLHDPKYLRYVPNTGHRLEGADIFESIAVFYIATLAGWQIPKYTWTMDADGKLAVDALSGVPARVMLWQATNPQARDFRFATIGAAWTATDLTDEGGGRYTARVDAPPAGWTAFFIELDYDSGLPYHYKFTTGVYVIPDDIPRACDGSSPAW